MNRVEGVVKIAALADSWGLPIPEDDDCYLDLTEKGRFLLRRVKELKAEGAELKGAFELAESEADQLFAPPETTHADSR